MRITYFSIENFRGIRALEFRPKSLTVISGGNGLGKTSVIDALKCVMEGGSDPADVRNGEEEARICIEIDDGAFKIVKKITRKGFSVSAKGPDGKKIDAVQTWIKSLNSGFAFDPLDFLDQKPAEQRDYIQQFLKVPVTNQEIRDAIGLYKPDKLPTGSTDGIAVIDAFADSVYADRAALNASHKQLTGYLNTLADQIPDTDTADVAAELERVSNEMSELSSNELHLIEEIRAGQTEAVAQIRLSRQKLIDERNKALEEAIAILRKENADNIELVSTASMREMEEASQVWSDRRDAEVAPITDQKASLGAMAAELQRQTEAYHKAAGAREELAKLRIEVTEIARKTERMTMAMSGLESLKKRKMDLLEIPGVQIKNGDIYVDDVPLAKVNTARKYQVALSLGSLTVGELPIIVVDSAEAMVGETRRQFEEVCRNADLNLQVFAAFAHDGEFSVVTE